MFSLTTVNAHEVPELTWGWGTGAWLVAPMLSATVTSAGAVRPRPPSLPGRQQTWGDAWDSHPNPASGWLTGSCSSGQRKQVDSNA